MQFYASSPNISYVVKPAIYQYDQTGRRTGATTPLRIEFRNHFWDSELAQKRHKWTEKERGIAEKYLKEHNDYGSADLKFRVWADGDTAADLGNSSMPNESNAVYCAFVIPTDQGAEICARKITDKGDMDRRLCSVHVKAGQPEEVAV